MDKTNTERARELVAQWHTQNRDYNSYSAWDDGWARLIAAALDAKDAEYEAKWQDWSRLIAEANDVTQRALARLYTMRRETVEECARVAEQGKYDWCDMPDSREAKPCANGTDIAAALRALVAPREEG